MYEAFASIFRNETRPHDLAHSFSSIPLLQILISNLLDHHIKRGFRTEPARPRRPNTLVRKRRILLLDLEGLNPFSSGGRISQQLRMAAFLQTGEPEDARVDGLAHGEETVVLQEDGLLWTESLGDVFAFLFGEDDAFEAVVDGVVVVEGAGVLGGLLGEGQSVASWDQTHQDFFRPSGLFDLISQGDESKTRKRFSLTISNGFPNAQ